MEQITQELNSRLSRTVIRRQIPVPDDISVNGALLSDVLLEKQHISPQIANELLEEASGVRAIDPQFISFSKSFINHASLLIPKEISLEENVFPIKHEGNFVYLLMASPLDEELIARMEALTGSRIKRYCCYSSGIKQAIEEHYPSESSTLPADSDELINYAVSDVQRMINKHDGDITTALTNIPSVIRFLRMIFHQAVNLGVSDIHFETQKDEFRIRVRQDGVLRTAWKLPLVLSKALITRLKLITNLELSEGRPQDGRIDYHLVDDHEIDIRVSMLPGVYGDKAVLRILEKGKNRLVLKDLNLDAKTGALFQQMLERPNGLILLTGPTGSGKTTTLYALLAELNTEEVNISTAEDPVEYELLGITQVDCGEKSGVTFAGALKSFLRQDPDIIMVGEIRDLETGDIAVKSALTGHLVLSTLHTNDAPSAVTRLVNIGVPPFLLAACGLTIVAQRLVRRICSSCKEPLLADAELLSKIDMEPDEFTIYTGKGCDRCAGTGYKGRVALLEVFSVDEIIEKLIVEEKGTGDLRRAAIEAGMVTLRKDGIEKIKLGATTPEEVLRVTLDL